MVSATCVAAGNVDRYRPVEKATHTHQKKKKICFFFAVRGSRKIFFWFFIFCFFKLTRGYMSCAGIISDVCVSLATIALAIAELVLAARDGDSAACVKSSSNLIDQVTWKTWLIVHGAVTLGGAVIVCCYTALTIRGEAAQFTSRTSSERESSAFAAIVAQISGATCVVLLSLFSLSWAMVGAFKFWHDCDSHTGSTSIDKLLWAVLIVSFAMTFCAFGARRAQNSDSV